MRAERGFGVRRGIGRDDPDQERSQNRPAAIQRLSLPKATSMLLAIRDGALQPSRYLLVKAGLGSRRGAPPRDAVIMR